MERVKFVLPVVLFAWFAIALGESQIYVEYGQKCHKGNETTPSAICLSKDPEDPIKCNNLEATPIAPGLCMCDDDLIRVDGRCVSYHGKRCTLKSNDGSPERKCTKFSECWPNAQSTLEKIEGTCHCDSYASYDEQTGLCKLKYGSNGCEKRTDCDILGLLTCNEGKCVCADEEFQKWDGDKTCVSLFGGSCAINPPYPVTPKCLGVDITTVCNNATKVCECKEGFIDTPEKLCGKPFDANCTANNECHPQFECKGETDKKCVCPDGQHFDGDNCRLLVNQQCNLTTSLLCTPHSFCVNGSCQCDASYTASANKTCVGLYGSSCKDVGCNDEDHLSCNDQDKVCECKADYDSDNTDKKCIGHIGQACRNSEECVANSKCTNNACACENRQEQQAQACVALHGAKCDEIITKCSTTRFLTCLNSTCHCLVPDDQLFNPISDYCEAKADTSCGASASGIKCVENSTCSDPSPHACKCTSNHVKDSEGRCVPGRGGGSSVASSTGLITAVVIVLFSKF